MECTARVLVNAAGPWAPRVGGAIQPAIPIPDVDLVQGAHIVLPFPVTAGIYYVESPTDGRAVFRDAVARRNPDRHHRNPPTAANRTRCTRCPKKRNTCSPFARHYFPDFSHLTREHITQRFAGLRVPPCRDPGGLRPVAGNHIHHRPRAQAACCSASTAASSPAGAQPPRTSWNESACPCRHAQGGPQRIN